MNMTGIDVQFVPTIQLWQAILDGYCGCAECIMKTPIGFGKTREAAVADLLEKSEQSANSYRVSKP